MDEWTMVGQTINKAFSTTKMALGIGAGMAIAGVSVVLAIPDSNENIAVAQSKKALFSKESILDKPVFYFNDAATSQNVAALIAANTEQATVLIRYEDDLQNVQLLKSSLWNLTNE